MKDLETLEIDLTYLQNSVSELSAVVKEQADEIAILQKKIKLLNEKIEELEGGAETRRPPHY